MKNLIYILLLTVGLTTTTYAQATLTVDRDSIQSCCVNIQVNGGFTEWGWEVKIRNSAGEVIATFNYELDGNNFQYCFDEIGVFEVELWEFGVFLEDEKVANTDCEPTCNNDSLFYDCSRIDSFAVEDCNFCFDVFLFNECQSIDVDIDGEIITFESGVDDFYGLYTFCYEFMVDGMHSITVPQQSCGDLFFGCPDTLVICTESCNQNPPPCPELRIVANCGFGEVCNPCKSDFDAVDYLAVQSFNTTTMNWEYVNNAEQIRWYDTNGFAGFGTFIVYDPDLLYAEITYASYPGHGEEPTYYDCTVLEEWECEEKSIEQRNENASSDNEAMISIFPNPARDYINLRTTFSVDQQVQLFNQTGQEVYTNTIKGNSGSVIDLNNLSPGLYFISVSELTSGKQLSVEKIVVE